MNVKINSDEFKLTDFAANLLSRKAERISQRVRRFFNESFPINIKVSERDGKVRIEAVVKLGKDTLHAAKAAISEVEAVRDSMNSLLRQFDKIRIRKVPALRKKNLQRKSARKLVLAPVPLKPTKLPNQIIEELYPFLRRTATEKVALFQAIHGIEPGYLDPDEIVDEVLVERIADLDPELGMAEVKRQLFEAVLATVKSHANEYDLDSARIVSTDQDIPELDEKIELSTLGDEVLDFWVIDEDLKLSDVIESPDKRTPEDIVSDKEARHVLMNALLRLSPDSRYIFTSYVMDENSLKDVAAFVGESEIRTEQILRDATISLRSFLTDSDSILTDENVVALYRRMSEMFQADPRGISRAGAGSTLAAAVSH